ncbi:hypothetical protein AOQ84DRAFT_76140 [Glonium stellatum]|uniref:Uncharacterized protein n=1 Tax=Glonium stellatum TaxID=574774 RepID=A0A8E2EX97_9PEZI|nr:hypothetical protein AOQ84DRAFT_76140 [Glonium stellatum]
MAVSTRANAAPQPCNPTTCRLNIRQASGQPLQLSQNTPQLYKWLEETDYHYPRERRAETSETMGKTDNRITDYRTLQTEPVRQEPEEDRRVPDQNDTNEYQDVQVDEEGRRYVDSGVLRLYL